MSSKKTGVYGMFGTCPECKQRKSLKLNGRLRLHRVVNKKGVLEECSGTNSAPFIEKPKDGLTPGLRAALDGIPGPYGWDGYEDSRGVYAEIGGALLELGLSDEDAAKIMEGAFWAAVRVYR